MHTSLRSISRRSIRIGAALLIGVFLGGCDSKPSDDSGAALFKKKCSTCHALEPGKHKVGPSLAGILGRKAGSTDFPKYRALKDADFTWDKTNIAAWISDPKKFIGKPTAMTVKIKVEKDRQAIIEYLSEKHD